LLAGKQLNTKLIERDLIGKEENNTSGKNSTQDDFSSEQTYRNFGVLATKGLAFNSNGFLEKGQR
jgi:hypothetical protein